MLTTAQLYELTKNGSDISTDIIITLDVMADRIKQLETRIRQLEQSNPASTAKLKLVSNDG
jgi:16S rRNA C967 or C1407 C5-methylase (RsmB/RsmF family)